MPVLKQRFCLKNSPSPDIWFRSFERGYAGEAVCRLEGNLRKWLRTRNQNVLERLAEARTLPMN